MKTLEKFYNLHPRYSHDLFYIAPLLHLALPLVHQLIMIDADLIFRKSIIINIVFTTTTTTIIILNNVSSSLLLQS